MYGIIKIFLKKRETLKYILDSLYELKINFSQGTFELIEWDICRKDDSLSPGAHQAADSARSCHRRCWRRQYRERRRRGHLMLTMIGARRAWRRYNGLTGHGILLLPNCSPATIIQQSLIHNILLI